MKNRPVFVACVTVFTATLALMPAAAQRPQPTDALGLRIDRPKMLRKGNQAIPQHYIVVLDMDAAGREGNLSAARTVTDDLAFRAGAEVTHVYAHAINGFSARMSDTQAVALSEDPRVAFVEEDSMMYATVTQTNPPWGLDRIDQRDLPLNQAYSYTTTGSGVNAYIIDTGIRRTHTQFGGRAVVGFDAIGDGQNTNDCNGHGTHVVGDRRRIDLRRRESGAAVRGARAQLLRVGLDLRRHRRRELGDGQPRHPGGREHEPRRRRVDARSTPRCATRSRRA